MIETKLVSNELSMKKETITPGDLLQINPVLTSNKAFAGCIMVATEMQEDFVKGYIQGIGPTRNEAGNQYYYKAYYYEVELVGFAEWWIPV